MNKRMLLALVALAGVFVALYLTLYKLGYIGTLACAVGSCETVQTSKWATFLGLPVGAWGVGYYIGVLALAIAGLTGRFADSRRLSEILLVWFGSGQGTAEGGVSLLELSEGGVRKLGRVKAYASDCGALDAKGETASVLFASPGPSPSFSLEKYVSPCGDGARWRTSTTKWRGAGNQ